MVEILVSARKALEPISYPRLQDFLDMLQSFEAYLRFQPALIFPLAASRQLQRALTIRYRDSSVDSNIPGTSLDQGVSSHFKILSAEIEIEPTWPQSLFASISQFSSRSLLKGRARLLSPALAGRL